MPLWHPTRRDCFPARHPPVLSRFFRNEYYKSQEEYLYAIADAMRFEYEAVADGGLTLQLDCPDLAMGRHVQYMETSRPGRVSQAHAAAY